MISDFFDSWFLTLIFILTLIFKMSISIPELLVNDGFISPVIRKKLRIFRKDRDVIRQDRS